MSPTTRQTANPTLEAKQPTHARTHSSTQEHNCTREAGALGKSFALVGAGLDGWRQTSRRVACRAGTGKGERREKRNAPWLSYASNNTEHSFTWQPSMDCVRGDDEERQGRNKNKPWSFRPLSFSRTLLAQTTGEDRYNGPYTSSQEQKSSNNFFLAVE